MLCGWILLWHEKATYFAHSKPLSSSAGMVGWDGNEHCGEEEEGRKRESKVSAPIKYPHCVGAVLYCP